MLVYTPGLQSEHRLVWVDRTGTAEDLDAPPDHYHTPRIAPDGQSVALVIGGEFGNVWRYGLSSKALVQLTFEGCSRVMIWSPDGSHLTVSAFRGTGTDLLHRSAGGSTPPHVLLTSPVMQFPSSWSSDARTLAFVQHGVAGEHEIWTLTPAASGKVSPVVQDPGSQWGAQVSPDGRWMAYTSTETGSAEVYVTAFPHGRPKWKVSTSGGEEPVWARSGRELFYRSGLRMMTVPVDTSGGFTPGVPSPLFSGRYYVRRPGDPNYDVSPDDQHFLMVVPGNTEGADRMNVI